MGISLSLILMILMIVGLIKLDFVIISLGITICLGIWGFISSFKKIATVGSQPKKRQQAMTFIVCMGIALAIMNMTLVIYMIVNYFKLFIVLVGCAFVMSVLQAIILKIKRKNN